MCLICRKQSSSELMPAALWHSSSELLHRHVNLALCLWNRLDVGATWMQPEHLLMSFRYLWIEFKECKPQYAVNWHQLVMACHASSQPFLRECLHTLSRAPGSKCVRILLQARMAKQAEEGKDKRLTCWLWPQPQWRLVYTFGFAVATLEICLSFPRRSASDQPPARLEGQAWTSHSPWNRSLEEHTTW